MRKMVFAVVVLGALGAVGVARAGDDLREIHAEFERRCGVCHGANGQGDGPAAVALSPKPRNFSDKELMATIDDARLRKSISEGRPGTPMVGYKGILTEKQIDEMIRLIRSFVR
ncbi:MAG: cytochrome c [Myxococcales bacterium]|nr:cytochrome c [Myxococcales bacterium]